MSELLLGLVVLPIGAAVVPFLLAPVRERTGWPVAAVALAGQTALAVAVALRVAASGPVSTTVGGWPATVGIELVADGLSVPFVLLVAAVSAVLLAYTRVGGPRSTPFYSLYLLLAAGLTGVCLAGDVFNLYVFLEVSGLAAYALVARSAGGPAALAALRYLLMGTVGATLYLLGVGYAYLATGTLNMGDLAVQLRAAGYGSPIVVAAFALMVVGLAVKVALVPLHTWLPGAHSEAPVPVSVLLSGVVTSVAAYAVVRLALTVFTPRFFAVAGLADDLLLVGASASVLYGGYAAVREHRVKRVLAYSTIAQVGLAVLGLGVLGSTAVVGGVFHLVGHGVMKGGLFLVAGCFAAGYGATSVDDYAGLARREPVLGTSFAVLALGMVGFPLTPGLVSKWYIALGAAEAGAWAVAGLVLVSSLLSLAVFGPILARLYADGLVEPTPVGRLSAGMRSAAVVAVLATVALGLSGAAVASVVGAGLAGVG